MLARLALIAAFALAGSASAQAMSEADIKAPIGADDLEGRLDGDLNGDRQADTVFVQRREDSRKITKRGKRPVRTVYMEDTPSAESLVGVRPD